MDVIEMKDSKAHESATLDPLFVRHFPFSLYITLFLCLKMYDLINNVLSAFQVFLSKFFIFVSSYLFFSSLILLNRIENIQYSLLSSFHLMSQFFASISFSPRLFVKEEKINQADPGSLC